MNRNKNGDRKDYGNRKAYVALLVAMSIFLFALSAANYLLFHSLVEGYAIVVAVLIYVLALKTYNYSKNNYFLFVGIAYLYVGVIDFFHTIAYSGMGVFPGLGSDPPTQLWILARYVEAISLLFAPFYVKRAMSYVSVMITYGAVTCAGILSILWLKVFPTCFIEGYGLTLFKIASEYVICAILAVGIGWLYHNRLLYEDSIYETMVASMSITIISELSFTLYTDVYGFMNFTGHVLKAVSFILIYNGVIKAGLENPYRLIFRELKISSSTDYLTGLVNRGGFYEQVEHLIEDSHKRNFDIGILLMDIDNFKIINDKYGHLFGDEVLKQFSNLIMGMIRKEDIASRFGGDEFIIITKATEKELDNIRQRLTARVEEWIQSDDRLKGFGLSVGTAACKPEEEFNIDRFIDEADRDMYHKKKNKAWALSTR